MWKLLWRPTLWSPMDYSLPGSSVLGILQPRILEWVAIPFSRGSSQPRGLNSGLTHCRRILYNLSLWFKLLVPRIHLKYCPQIEDISDVKVIRTDATFDLSQKAERIIHSFSSDSFLKTKTHLTQFCVKKIPTIVVISQQCNMQIYWIKFKTDVEYHLLSSSWHIT